MAAASRLFGADRLGHSAVQLQGGNSGSARGSQAHDRETAPTKMLAPPLSARMEERDGASGLRVLPGSTRLFPKRTRDTSQGQVVGSGQASCGPRHNVVNVEGCFLPVLGQSAVLTPITRAEHDPTTQWIRDAAHRRFEETAARPAPSARRRRSVSNSASSTKPSASDRSA
jgi:hypothetical protein